jgi:hypothetical protein
MSDLVKRSIKGLHCFDLCRFFFYFYYFKICKYLLLNNELDNDKCPSCGASEWYRGPPVCKKLEQGYCYMHFPIIVIMSCFCTIEPLLGICPWCRSRDRWHIPPEFLVSVIEAYTCLTEGQKFESLSRVLQGTPLIRVDRFGNHRRDRPWEM